MTDSIKQSEPLSPILSVAIRQAAEDIQKCRKDPRYTLNMLRWHEPIGDTCYVCLAGSVIACRTPYDPDTEYNWISASAHEHRMLSALNEIREYCIDGALAFAYGGDQWKWNVVTHPYTEEPRSKFSWIFSTLSNELQSEYDEDFQHGIQTLLEIADYVEGLEKKYNLKPVLESEVPE